MKTDTPTAGSHFSNLLLTGNLLLAQVDFNGLFDYALKAGLGGSIWLIFKILADFIDTKRKAARARREKTSPK